MAKRGGSFAYRIIAFIYINIYGLSSSTSAYLWQRDEIVLPRLAIFLCLIRLVLHGNFKNKDRQKNS